VANGPKVILDANGQASAQAPRDYFQPIVDLIRKNGFTGIIWDSLSRKPAQLL
jgi:hypothetical protein